MLKYQLKLIFIKIYQFLLIYKKKIIPILLSIIILLILIKLVWIKPNYDGRLINDLDEHDKIFNLLVNDIHKFKESFNGQGGVSFDPKLKIVIYRFKEGDNFWDISKKTGLSIDALLSINNLKNVHIVQPNQEIRIPNKNGILYTAKEGDTLESIAEKFKVQKEHIISVNELADESIDEGEDIFIPNGKLNFEERQNFLGQFILPIRGRITSGFGWRKSPTTKRREYHTGVDIANVPGTRVLAAQSGTVIFVGEQGGYGKLIIIQHKNGYSTRYGHLSRYNVAYGQKVKQGQVVGYVGSTGNVTGPHLHFEIRQYGKPLNAYFLMRFSQK